MPARRQFLQLLAGGTAGALLRPRSLAAHAVDLASGTPDEAYWRLVKAEFPVRPGLVMMNAANLCPSPFEVRDTVARLTRDIDADASFQNRAKFNTLREEARSSIASLVGADADEIALTRNTSEGNNTVVSGLALGPGDEVVVWDENHPTNKLSWEVRGAREGFTVRSVSVDATGDLAAPLLNALTDRTRVLSFSHLSNVSGVLLPAAELCAQARQRGVLTLVDGAQTFGNLNLDLHAIGCDFYSASSHKWFVGPKEAGILYVRKERQDDVWASDVGLGWATALENGAQKFESLGQRDDACVSAMGTAATFHARIGPDKIQARVHQLGEALVEGLSRRVDGIGFTMPPNPSNRAGVVIFTLPGISGGDAFNRLYEEHDIASAPRGPGVRLSPHIYNTLEDVERAIDAVAAIA